MRTEYETKRLVLRLSSPYIAGAVQSLYVNNAEFFAKNETAVKHIETMSINDLSRHLTVDAKLSTVGHSYRFWIFEKGSERCIGCPRQGKFAKRVPVKQIRPQPGVAFELNSR